jgi:adenine/guanine phosphoribosyltransferase-like PRPP-binding protein
LVKGKKVVIIDDAVSSGKTLQASWDFLESEEVGCHVLEAGVVMKQGERWRSLLGERQKRVRWVFECPLLRVVEGGWDVRE